jgi:hypothetical protein
MAKTEVQAVAAHATQPQAVVVSVGSATTEGLTDQGPAKAEGVAARALLETTQRQQMAVPVVPDWPTQSQDHQSPAPEEEVVALMVEPLAAAEQVEAALVQTAMQLVRLVLQTLEAVAVAVATHLLRAVLVALVAQVS